MADPEIGGASFLLLQEMLKRIEALEKRTHRLNVQILTSLSRLERQGEKLMAIGQETARVISEIDAATTAIATRIDQLVLDSDLTAEEKAEFQRISERLRALGANPEQPVPPA